MGKFLAEFTGVHFHAAGKTGKQVFHPLRHTLGAHICYILTDKPLAAAFYHAVLNGINIVLCRLAHKFFQHAVNEITRVGGVYNRLAALVQRQHIAAVVLESTVVEALNP